MKVVNHAHPRAGPIFSFFTFFHPKKMGDTCKKMRFAGGFFVLSGYNHDMSPSLPKAADGGGSGMLLGNGQ